VSNTGHSTGRWEGDTLAVDTVGFAEGVLVPPTRNSRSALSPREQISRSVRSAVHHGGSLPGFQAEIARFPDDDLTVIVLTNADSGQPEQIANVVAATYFRGALKEGSESPRLPALAPEPYLTLAPD
jgi:hypothetical protein